MDYAGRLRTVQAAMAEQGITLMFLPRAANLYYLTGIRRQLEHGTDHNAYGDWLSGGYIGQEGPVQVVAPRMGGGFWQHEAEGKPWISGVRLIMEPEAPVDVLKDLFTGFGLASGNQRIDVEDKIWEQVTIAATSLFSDLRIVNATEIIAP